MPPGAEGASKKPSTTAIVVSEDLEVTDTLRTGLEKVVGRVSTVPAVEVIPESPAAAIVVVHLTSGVDEAAQKSVATVPHECPVIIALGGNDLADVAAALGASPQVVGVLTADRATPDSVAELARRAIRGNIFGLAGKVTEGTKIHEVPVVNYDDKLRCIEKITRFAKESKIRGKYRDGIAQCVDEMLMNALYEAPREASMGSLSSLEMDKAKIAARAQQPVLVQYAYGDGILFLAVRDNYGSLRRDALLEHWRHAMDAQRDGEDALEGGLGLYIMSHSSTSLVFNEIPGVATECIGAFDVRSPKMQVQELGLLRETDRHSIAHLTAELEKQTPKPAPVEETQIAGPSRNAVLLLVGLAVVVLVLLVLLIAGRS